MIEHEVPEACWISPHVEVRTSERCGVGLFASMPISRGQVVLVWGGPSYTDIEGARRARAEGRGVMQWDDDVYSVETTPLEDAFRINHSCEPNVWMEDVFTLTARRDIAVDEELRMDYATILDDDTQPASWTCLCATPSCRRLVTGDDWRLPRLEAAYRGHFSPRLEKRISASK